MNSLNSFFVQKYFWFVLLISLFGLTKLRAQTHPFMIVQASEYASLQALSVGGASKAPYIAMRTSAISTSNTTTISSSSSIGTRAQNLTKIMDSTALAYIADPSNRNTYRNRFYQYLKYWDLAETGNITKDLNLSDWNATVPPAAAFFATVIAMDIIYNDPNTTATQIAQRTNFIALMETAGVAGPPNTMGPATFFNTQYEPYHLESLMSARAIWALWKGGISNNTALNDAVTIYKDHWRDHITDDGCYREFGGYSMARAGDPSRYNKGVFHDVIVYTGIDPNWYADAKMSKFYEYLAGYALGPNRYTWPIGDSSYCPFSSSYASPFDRAAKFSSLAGNYGEWQQNGVTPPAKLFSYLVRARTLPIPVSTEPVSRIFADGGAFFLQKNGGTNSLAAVLTNLKTTNVPNLGHLHRSTNSLSIASFGEILLRGPGYNGYGAAATDANNFGFDFSYVNNHAISENVALFNYNISNYQNPSFTNDHAKKHGGSGVQGLLSDGLDYATGNSGLLSDSNRAITNGQHTRHVVAVYPQNGVNGYVYSIDELLGNASATTGQLAWHPYSPTITFNSDNSSNDRYEWQIRKKANTTDQLYLSIFMPTIPAGKQQYNGLFADDIQGGTSTSFVGKYIFNTYNLDPTTKKKNVLTMFFPRKSTQTIPTMERITPTGAGAAQAAAFAFAGNVTDFTMESDGTNERTIASPTYDAVGAAARGKAVVYRKVSGSLAFYFVGKGRSFKNTPSGFNQGFVSDDDVDIHLKGTTGKIVSSGTNVTFYAIGNPIVRLDGNLVSSISSGAGFVRIAVPAGTHTIALEQTVGGNTVPNVTIPTASNSITLPANAVLIGNVTDDGLPAIPGATSVVWTRLSGPGNVTFTNPTGLGTNAYFSAPGAYVLRLTATDGALSAYMDVTINVAAFVSGNPLQTIYRETFGNASVADVRFNVPTINWRHYTAPDNVTNITDSSGSNGGSDARAGRPINLDNINAGTSASQTNGFANSVNVRRALVFTTELPIDRSVYVPTSFTWWSHLSDRNVALGGLNNQTPAVRIAGQWYIINLSTALAGNFVTTGGGSNFSSSSSQVTLDFSTATTTVTTATPIITTGWRTLSATSGSPFTVGSSNVALPTGNIEAFGVYFTTAGDCSARFDSFEIKATLAPLTTTTLLSSNSNPAISGTPVVFTAHVDSAAQATVGSVTFYDGATNLGAATLDSNGTATFTTTSLNVGTHMITATYAANNPYLASNSGTVSQVINLTPFNAWRVAKFTPAELSDGDISGPTANPDKDYANNFLEYALDTNPLTGNGVPTTSSILTVSLPEGGSEQRLALTFPRVREELDYTVEGSSDLETWESIETNSGTVGSTITVPDTEPAIIQKRFLRLRVTQP